VWSSVVVDACLLLAKCGLMLAKDLKCLTGLVGVASGDCDRTGAVQQSFAAAIARCKLVAKVNWK
jgi:hypothetical protein